MTDTRMNARARNTSSPAAVPLIRYAYALDYLDRLDVRNVSYARAARQAKLPLLVSDPRDLIAKRPLWRFVDTAARTANEPILGLHAGEFTVTEGHATSLSERARLAGPTVADGLRAFTRLARAEANELPCGVLEHSGDLWPWTHGLTATEQGPPGAAQMELFFLGALLGVIRSYLGQGWNPPVVWLQNQRCPRGLKDALGGAHILTGRPILAVKVPAAEQSRSIFVGRRGGFSSADTNLPPSDLIGGLRYALTSSFPDAAATPVTLELAAEFARIGPRTLQRRLAEHGLRFRDLHDQALAASAGRCLLDTSVSIAEISHMHGYADVTHFCRAFRRATAMSPGEFSNQRSGQGSTEIG